MDQIVLFWRGEDISIPKYFVNSILIRNLKNVKIIQVSDLKTEKIKGVDLFITDNFPEDLMTARLKAYSKIKTKDTNTIFCDADSLLLNDITLSNFSPGYYLMRRKGNFVINHLLPEHYPEFENKPILDIMPFLFGAIIIVKKENFFKYLYNICMQLPARFHRWYGDQLSLYIYYLDNKHNFSFFDQSKYMHVIGTKNKDNVNISLLKKRGVIFLTFKGTESKNSIKNIFDHIVSTVKE